MSFPVLPGSFLEHLCGAQSSGMVEGGASEEAARKRRRGRAPVAPGGAFAAGGAEISALRFRTSDDVLAVRCRV